MKSNHILTIASFIIIESESASTSKRPNYIFPLHDFSLRLRISLRLDYVPRMLSTNTLININIRAQARTQRFIIVPGVREWELMDVNFYVNKAIREICCCYCWFLLCDINTQRSNSKEEKLLCIWKERNDAFINHPTRLPYYTKSH